MDKILAVTGATGKKSGGAFFKILNENCSTVLNKWTGIRIIVRKELKEKPVNYCDVCAGDCKDKEFIEKALAKVDTVVHIAGISLSRNIVDAAVKNNVRRIILVHTTGIYSKYKKAGEEYRKIDAYVEQKCKEKGIILTILRPTMIYGNTSDNNVINFVKMVDKFPIMPVVKGAKFALQPVHYEDLAKAYYQVLINEETTANKNFNLSGGNEILLIEMLVEIGKNLGKKVKFFSCPYFIAYGGAWLLYLLTFTKKDYREKVQRLCEPRVYSYKDAQIAFGYSPRTFQEGIINEIKEYKRNKQK